MSSLEIPFYDVLKPSNDEVIMVNFTEHKKEYINGKLIDYPCDLFLNYSDATKKRKVTSWQKIVPLNKPMMAKVEDVDYAENIVRVSLSYMYDSDENKALMEAFSKNSQLISFFKRLSHFSGVDINILWSDIMYKIDANRRKEYDGEDMPTLYNYCDQERDFIRSIFEQVGRIDVVDKFFEQIDIKKKEKPQKIVSNVEIISNGGVQNTKLIIEKVLATLNFENCLKYSTAPIYLFETKSCESSEEDHKKFIEMLAQEGQKMVPKSFVRCQSTVRIDL
jgi:hypothetical protein